MYTSQIIKKIKEEGKLKLLLRQKHSAFVFEECLKSKTSFENKKEILILLIKQKLIKELLMTEYGVNRK